MSESLAWEKWSSFSHNRYVEEAERYSKPGSVAQKKAFFEAHYKKLAAQKAAAALLEQANNEAQNNATGQENEGVIDNDNDTDNSQISPNYEIGVKEEQNAKILSITSESSSTVEASVTHESVKIEEAKPVMEEVPVEGNSMKVELQKQVEDVDGQKEQSEKLSAILTPPMLTPILKVIIILIYLRLLFLVLNFRCHNTYMLLHLKQVSKSDQEVLASASKKKPPVSSIKFSKAYGTSKFTSTPVKSTAAISFKRDNIATPMSNKAATLSTADKKRATPRSVNFTPIRELNRLTASVMRKFESTRNGAASSKASKDNLTPLRTPTMVFHLFSFVFSICKPCRLHFAMIFNVAFDVKDAKVSHFSITGCQGDEKAFFIDPIN